MATRTMGMGEVKHLINYAIDNNFKRQSEKGETPIAICLEAEAGIGK